MDLCYECTQQYFKTTRIGEGFDCCEPISKVCNKARSYNYYISIGGYLVNYTGRDNKFFILVYNVE